jgi:hypothetical protein
MDDLKKALEVLSEGNNRLTGAEQLIYSKPTPKKPKVESWIKPYMMLVESEMAGEETPTVEEVEVDERSVSQAQAHLMAAAAHNPQFAKKVGMKQSVAKEYNRADKGRNIKSLPVRKGPVDEGYEV